jgi:hypothetical protein
VSIGGPDFREGPSQELPVGHQLLAGDEDMANVPPTSGIDEKRPDVRGFRISRPQISMARAMRDAPVGGFNPRIVYPGRDMGRVSGQTMNVID